MRATLALIVVLTVTPCAAQSVAPRDEAMMPHADDSRWLHLAIGTMATTMFADLATTEYCLGRGTCREANAVFGQATMRGPVTAGIVKGLTTVGATEALLFLHKKHPKITLLIASIYSALFGTVAWHNGRLK